MTPRARDLERALADANALPRLARCLVAVSGGRDSLVLLHLLAELRPTHGWHLVVAHLHHGLRGTDADADARSVRAAARALRLPFTTDRIDVRRSRRRGESLEEAARRCRHTFLARAARRLRCPTIATGHHADDQVELFLLRLLRGSGPDGLAGMNAVDPSPVAPDLTLVRPLLPFDGAWLDSAARDLGITYREDASNRDPAFLRNRVRHELIPLLQSRFQPALGRILRRVQTLLRDQNTVIAAETRAWAAQPEPRNPPFAELPTARQRLHLRHQLLEAALDPDFELVESLRSTPGQPVQFDARRRVQRDAHGTVELLPATPRPARFRASEKAVELQPSPGRTRFQGARFDWQTIEVTSPPAPRAAAPNEEHFDADLVGPGIRLRHWRPGDRFRPIGLPAAAKLQNLFVNAKVPAADRHRRVVAETSAGEIFWVEGLRIGHLARLTARTRRVLIWRWRRS